MDWLENPDLVKSIDAKFYLPGEMNLNDSETGIQFNIHSNHGSDIPTVVIATAVVQAIVAIIGVLSNALVIFVLVFARDKQDTSSVIYVLNLAVADLFFLLTVPFKIVQDIQLRWAMGELLCKLAWGFVTYLNFLVSVLFLMVMSIDRYLAVNRAVTCAKFRAISSSKIVSGIVWIVGICAIIPLASFHTAEGGTRCLPRFPGSHKMLPGDQPLFCNTDDSARFVTSNKSEPYDYGKEYYFFVNEDVDKYLEPQSIANNRSRPVRNINQEGRKEERVTTEQYQSSDELVSVVSIVSETGDLDYNLKDSNDQTFRVFQCSNVGEAWTMENVLSSTQFITQTEGTLQDPTTKTNSKGGIRYKTNLGNNRHFVLDEQKNPDFFQCHHPAIDSFKIWVVLNFFYSYFIPTSIIVTCYTAILRKLYQPSRSLRQTSSETRKVRKHTMRKKVTLMVALLVITYILCFTPYYIWQIAKIPGVKSCFHVERLTYTLTIINSAINPLLYTFLCDKFSAKFQRACQKFLRRLNISPNPGGSSSSKKQNSKMEPTSSKNNVVILPRGPLHGGSYDSPNGTFKQKRSNSTAAAVVKMDELHFSCHTILNSKQEHFPLITSESNHKNRVHPQRVDLINLRSKEADDNQDENIITLKAPTSSETEMTTADVAQNRTELAI